MTGKKYWIHNEVAKMSKMDRTKVSIDFYVRNMLSLENYTDRELKEVGLYFAKQCRAMKLNYNQTS